MTEISWSFVKVAARLLEGDEREAVLGDLREAARAACAELLDVFGLAVRRQLSLWKDWRPWLASFGMALPGSLLLMGYSLSVSQTYQRLIHPTIFRVIVPKSPTNHLFLLQHAAPLHQLISGRQIAQSSGELHEFIV